MIRPPRPRHPEIRISVITDISANVFAVFMLILIVVLAAASRPAAPPEAIDAITDLGGIRRAPLSAGTMIDLLYARSRGAADRVAARVDLHEARIVVAKPGLAERTVRGDAEIATALADLTATTRGPVVLYIFSHRHIGVAVRTLGADRITDLSVPDALRQGGAAGGDDWSDGFRALIAGPLSRQDFIAGLARLLAADPAGRRGGGGNRGDPMAATIDLAARLSGWWRGVAPWLALAFGLVFIAAVERRRPR